MSVFFYLPFFQEWPGEVKLTENKFLIFMFLLNGFMFYMQSLTAFGLMSLISPVTFRFVFCCFNNNNNKVYLNCKNEIKYKLESLS